MQMTEGEIVRSYKEAKNKSQQVGILAELNCCSKEKIIEILKQEGTPSRELPRQRKKKDLVDTSIVVTKKNLEIKKMAVVEEKNKKQLPEAVKEAISKQMIEEQEAIDRHSQRLKELNDYLLGVNE